jgi:hypothetical protein
MLARMSSASKSREVRKDFLWRGTIRQHVQDILDANSHSANARSPAALIGVGGDAVHQDLI